MRHLNSGLWLLVVAISSAVTDAQTTANFSGVWLRQQPGEMRIRIEQSGNEFTITYRSRDQSGSVETNVEHFRTAAGSFSNQLHGAPMSSEARWDGPALVVDSVARFGDQNLRMSSRWTLSSDRKALTLVQSRQFGSEPSSTVTYLFLREPESSWTDSSSPHTEDNSQVMAAFTQALGVACSHCHVEGAMTDSSKPAFLRARSMQQMREWIAKNTPIEITCWTCHRGHALPPPAPAIDTNLWPARLDLSAEQAAQPAAKIYRNLRFFNSSAADLKASMLSMSASLGVDCSHCHVTGAFERDDNPAKNITRTMLAMVRDERREFTGIRIACATCHQGAVRPAMAP